MITNEILDSILSTFKKETVQVLDSPCGTLFFFRALPLNCQDFLATILNTDKFLFETREVDSLKMISEKDGKLINQAKRYLKFLITAGIMKVESKKIQVDQRFKVNFNNMLASKFSEDTLIPCSKKRFVSFDKVLKSMNSSLAELALFLLNSDGHFLITDKKTEFLKKSKIFTQINTQFALNTEVLNLLFLNKQLLLRFLVSLLIKSYSVEDLKGLLDLFFKVCFLKVGERVEHNLSDPKQSDFLVLLDFLGLICWEKSKFYCFPSVKCLFEDVSDVFEEEEKGKKFILESNFRIFCSNPSQVEERMLG